MKIAYNVSNLRTLIRYARFRVHAICAYDPELYANEELEERFQSSHLPPVAAQIWHAETWETI